LEEGDIFSHVWKLEKEWISLDPENRKIIVLKYPSKQAPKQDNWIKIKIPPCPRCSENQFEDADHSHGGTVTGKEWGVWYKWCKICGYLDCWEWFID
jgi:hypothetical protein